jgi:outer membrane protein OmpA-like peptidoglycan-associated protein
MSGIATAIGGAALIGAAATTYSSSQSAKAQAQAAQQAANSQQNANQQNYQMFQDSRGGSGSAVLPLYLKGSNGSLFEPQLGTDLVNAYGNSAVPLTTFQQAAGKLAPAQQGANDLTNGLFNGGVTKTLLDNQAPVNAQRLATARSSSMDALSQTLNAIDANQASRGYVGDSYSNRLLSFNAGQQAGNAVGNAQQQNLQQNADISNYGNVTLPLQNMTLPYSMAQQNAQQAFLPSDQWLQSIGQRMQPLNMLKIGYNGPFQYQPLPTPGPGAYSGGANAAGGIAGLASGLGGAGLQYYMQGQNQQNLLAQIQAQNQLQQQNSTALGEFNGTSPNPSFYNSGAALAGYNAVSGGAVDTSGALAGANGGSLMALGGMGG